MSSPIINFLSRFYRLFVSPFIHLFCGAPYGCRFVPTCSEYGQEALHIHGWIKGSLLAVKRISRCHPFARAGYDPVPHAIQTEIYPIQKR